VIYFWWNIWKERNRRTFEQKNPSTKTGGYALQRRHSTASVGNSQSSKLSVGLWLRLPFLAPALVLSLFSPGRSSAVSVAEGRPG
jgi:hypothetical protein